MPYSGHDDVCEHVRHLIFRQWHGVCGDAIAFKKGINRLASLSQRFSSAVSPNTNSAIWVENVQ